MNYKNFSIEEYTRPMPYLANNHRVLDAKKAPFEDKNTRRISHNKNLRVYLFIKHSFDFIAALILGIVLLVPMMIIAVCIKMNSAGPVFFSQLRIGENGEPFKLYKFRTMDESAPHDLATSQFYDAEKYITTLGLFLRRTSLDELPQLLNVLKGEMSFVGFRPVCITETKLNNLRREYGVFSCRPGITGLAQIRGRDDLHYKEKAKIDAEYAKNRSIKLDLYCLLKTIPVNLSQRGVK